jgi:hypothetical protein
MGVGISHTGGGTVTEIVSGVPVTVTQVTGTETDFEVLIHLGMDLTQDSRYFGDLRLGSIDGSFLIGPTVGLRF